MLLNPSPGWKGAMTMKNENIILKDHVPLISALATLYLIMIGILALIR